MFLNVFNILRDISVSLNTFITCRISSLCLHSIYVLVYICLQSMHGFWSPCAPLPCHSNDQWRSGENSNWIHFDTWHILDHVTCVFWKRYVLFFPRASERRVLKKRSCCITSSHLTFARLTSSHLTLLILHLHILRLLPLLSFSLLSPSLFSLLSLSCSLHR